MKTFCQSCGGGIEYPSIRPNFCPHCGTSMMSGQRPATSQASQRPHPQRRPVSPPPQYEEYYEEELPDIRPEEIAIAVRGGAHKPVLADDVVGTQRPGEGDFGRRPKITQKDFKALIKKMHTEKPEPIDVD